MGWPGGLLKDGLETSHFSQWLWTFFECRFYHNVFYCPYTLLPSLLRAIATKQSHIYVRKLEIKIIDMPLHRVINCQNKHLFYRFSNSSKGPCLRVRPGKYRHLINFSVSVLKSLQSHWVRLASLNTYLHILFLQWSDWKISHLSTYTRVTAINGVNFFVYLSLMYSIIIRQIAIKLLRADVPTPAKFLKYSVAKYESSLRRERVGAI